MEGKTIFGWLAGSFTSLLHAATLAAALSVVLLIALPKAHAQGETVLYSFCSTTLLCADGTEPSGALVADSYGNLYGTAQLGGTGVGGCILACQEGSVFELSPEPAAGCPSGTNPGNGWCLQVLYSFCSYGYYPSCYDGEDPTANVLLVATGTPYNRTYNVYGTTNNGGSGSWCQDPNGCGIVFELSPKPIAGICPSGTNAYGGWCETVLYNFCSQANCDDGSYPVGGLVRDSSGNFYGMNSAGVFKLSQVSGPWQESIIYSDQPSNGGLAIDSGGALYGVDAYQNVFKVAYQCFQFCSWHITNIHTFGVAKDGSYPAGTPVLDSAGNVYGVTEQGGSANYGTVWKLTLLNGKEAGTYKERILHSFTSVKTGYYPLSGVTLDSAGNVYGTTAVGGTYNTLAACQYQGLGNGCGTVFKLAVSGTLYTYKLLWSFNNTNGAFPFANLLLNSSGNLYGTAFGGGGENAGAVFTVNPSAPSTTTTLTSSANPSTTGEAVTFSATVSSTGGAPPDGETVSFMKGSTQLGTGTLSGGVANFTTSSLPLGTSRVDAVYSGDLNFAQSASTTLDQVVEK
jgi:hypothetical protein